MADPVVEFCETVVEAWLKKYNKVEKTLSKKVATSEVEIVVDCISGDMLPQKGKHIQ